METTDTHLISLLTEENFTISSSPYSLWEKYFSKVVNLNDRTIQTDMHNLRE